MKVLLGFFRSVCSVFALLFCALVLFSPSSAVGAVYTDTVEISSPNAVLSGDIISVNGSDGVRSNYGGGLVGERIISGTKITVSGDSAHGVHESSNPGMLKLSNSSIDITGGHAGGVDISQGYYAIEVSCDISGTKITVSGDSANGISTRYHSDALKLSNSSIDVTGNETKGIWIYYPVSNYNVDVSGTSIKVSGDAGRGIDFDHIYYNSRESLFSLKLSNSSIDVAGTGTKGIYISESFGGYARPFSADIIGTKIVVSGDYGVAVQTTGLDRADLALKLLNSSIDATGTGAHGIDLHSKSLVDLSGTKIAVSGDSGRGVYYTGQYPQNSLRLSNGSIDATGTDVRGIMLGFEGYYDYRYLSVDVSGTELTVSGERAQGNAGRDERS